MKFRGAEFLKRMVLGIIVPIMLILSGYRSIMLIGIPIAVSIYGSLTFVPKWIVENKIRQNKRKLILMIIVWILVSISTFAKNTTS